MDIKDFQKLADKYAEKVNMWEFFAKDKELREKQIAELKKRNPKAEIIVRDTKMADVGSSFNLSSYAEYRQALPSISKLGQYTPEGQYWGEWECLGSERMGNEFQRHYLRGAGRSIVDWLAGGGSAVALKSVFTGGKFFDKVFKSEQPAAAALYQVSKLFEGTPRQLPVSIYPKYGEKALFATNAVAAYNGPGVATIIIAKRFPMPDETEISSIVPWNGPTTMILEKGFMPKNSPYADFAENINVTEKKIDIKDNVFTFSGVLPEMTVIRLVRKGSSNFDRSRIATRYTRPKVNFNYNAVRTADAERQSLKTKELTSFPLRKSGAYASSFGGNGNFQHIPATESEKFKPAEKRSLEVNFRVDKIKRPNDSVYLSLGKGPDKPQYLSFAVMARVHSDKKRCRVSSVPMRFIFSGKCFQAYLPVNRWKRVTVELGDKLSAPYWSFLRIVQPDRILADRVNSVSYEINDVAVLAQRGKKK